MPIQPKFWNIVLYVSLLLSPCPVTAKTSNSNSHERQVEACGRVLRDMPSYLVSEYCSSHNAAHSITTNTALSVPTTSATVIPSFTSAPKTSIPDIVTETAASSVWTGSDSIATRSVLSVPTTSATVVSSFTSAPRTALTGVVTKTASNSNHINVPSVLSTRHPFTLPTIAHEMTNICLATTITTITSTVTAYTPRNDARSSQHQRRSEFCPEEGRPCRLVGFDEWAITEACAGFSGGV